MEEEENHFCCPAWDTKNRHSRDLGPPVTDSQMVERVGRWVAITACSKKDVLESLYFKMKYLYDICGSISNKIKSFGV